MDNEVRHIPEQYITRFLEGLVRMTRQLISKMDTVYLFMDSPALEGKLDLCGYYQYIPPQLAPDEVDEDELEDELEDTPLRID